MKKKDDKYRKLISFFIKGVQIINYRQAQNLHKIFYIDAMKLF